MKNKMLKILKENSIWILCFICILIFMAILENVMTLEIIKYDVFCHNIVINYLRSDWLTKIVKVITSFGGATVLITISMLSIIFIKKKRIGLYITVNLGFITVLNLLLKNIVQRERPIGFRLINESGYSFPSGHSMISTAFYGLIIYFVYKNVQNKKLRNTICILLTILIILIGCSRVYLGVHYASDVIAGAVTSIVYLIVFTRIISKMGGRNEERIKENNK